MRKLYKNLKGDCFTMKYMTPDFDVTVYEIEDVITLSYGDQDPNGGSGEGWWG